MQLAGFARINLMPVNEAIVGREAFESLLLVEIVVTPLGGGRTN